MKRVYEIAVLFQLVILLCFTVGMVDESSLFTPQTQCTTTLAAKNDSQYLDANTQRQNPTQAFVTFAKILQASPIKNRTITFATLIRSFEEQLLVTTAQHLRYAEFLRLGLPNTDIVFPFHYFW